MGAAHRLAGSEDVSPAPSAVVSGPSRVRWAGACVEGIPSNPSSFEGGSDRVMNRRTFVGALASGLLIAPLVVEAQPATKTWRIGLLTSGSREGAGADVRIAPFSQGLRELGYIEGRNVILETRYAEGRVERFPALAAELVDLKIDVLVAMSTPGALAAKRATSTIPIVMAAVGEPVEMKLVESLAHPGGNITGLSISAPQLAAKRLDLLKQALPKLSRVTVLWNSANQGMQTRFQETQRGANVLGVSMHSIAIQSPDDFDPVFGAKAMAALIAECRSGRARGTQMFLVSGGAPTLFAGFPDAAP